MSSKTIRSRLLLTCAGVALAGCGGGEAPSEARAGEAELVALLDAIQAGVTTPLPQVELPTHPEVVRLLDSTPRIELALELEPAVQDGVLARLGPADTRSGTDGEPQVRLGAAGYKWLKLDGFELEAETIGAIRLTARCFDTDSFVLAWGDFGSIKLEVQEPGEACEYVVSAEGLDDFEGRLSVLRVGVRQEADLEVSAAALISRDAAYAPPTGRGPRRLGSEVREAGFLHGGVALHYALPELGPGVVLTLGAAVLAEPVPLAIEVDGAPRFEESVSAREAWRELRLELPEGARELTVRAGGDFEGVLFLGEPTLFTPSASAPRVLVYLIDTLGARHMSLDGYERPTTPRIDALGAEGAWFERAFANSSWTPESVPALMTSMIARSNGVFHKYSKLDPDFTTVQEVFRSAGYATAAWSTNSNAGPARGTAQGFDSFFDHIARVTVKGELRTVPVDDVIAWLEAHRERPCFAYVHTAEPHHPYEPPAPFDTRFTSPDYAGPVQANWKPNHDEVKRGAVDPGDTAQLIGLYDGEVAFADAMLGELLDAMEARGLLEDTLVVVTADHGEAFGQHRFFGHGMRLVPELLRIPLVFWGAGVPRRGKLSENVQLLDIAPTLMELAGLEPAGLPFQGRSLVPLLESPIDPSRVGTGDWAERSLLVGVFDADPPRLGLVHGDWKLDFGPDERGEPSLALFDLVRDPDELEDRSEAEPERTANLARALLEAYLAAPRYDAGVGSSYEISTEQIERLRALGYVR